MCVSVCFWLCVCVRLWVIILLLRWENLLEIRPTQLMILILDINEICFPHIPHVYDAAAFRSPPEPLPHRHSLAFCSRPLDSLVNFLQVSFSFLLVGVFRAGRETTNGRVSSLFPLLMSDGARRFCSAWLKVMQHQGISMDLGVWMRRVWELQTKWFEFAPQTALDCGIR